MTMTRRSTDLSGSTQMDRWPLAPLPAQHAWDPSYAEQYANQYHGVRVLAPGLYGVWDEDADQAGEYFTGITIFTLPWVKVVSIPFRHGWTLRVAKVIRTHLGE